MLVYRRVVFFLLHVNHFDLKMVVFDCQWWNCTTTWHQFSCFLPRTVARYQEYLGILHLPFQANFFHNILAASPDEMFVASRRWLAWFFLRVSKSITWKIVSLCTQFTFKSKMGHLGSVTFLGAHMEVLDFYQILLEDTGRKMIKDGGWPMMKPLSTTP